MLAAGDGETTCAAGSVGPGDPLREAIEGIVPRGVDLKCAVDGKPKGVVLLNVGARCGGTGVRL